MNLIIVVMNITNGNDSDDMKIMMITIEWASAQVPPTPPLFGGHCGERERERETERERERERWMDGWMDGWMDR